jgi:hypothetical protein
VDETVVKGEVMIGFNKDMPFIGFLAAFYLLDVARLYVEHE